MICRFRLHAEKLSFVERTSLAAGRGEPPDARHRKENHTRVHHMTAAFMAIVSTTSACSAASYEAASGAGVRAIERRWSEAFVKGDFEKRPDVLALRSAAASPRPTDYRKETGPIASK